MNTGPIEKIACIGEVMVEMIPTAPHRANLGVAGDTYNTAVYLARLLEGRSTTVSYITALGTDRFSDRIVEEIDSHGILTDHIERRADKMPGLYAIDTDDAGERSFSYWRSDSAARTLFTAPCNITLGCLADFDLIYLSGISIAILPAAIRDDLIAALATARRNGAVLVYDSNFRPRLWEDQATARAINARLWAECDIALPSLDDEMALFGDVSEQAVLERMAGYSVSQGALKRGAAGPRSLTSGEVTPPARPIQTVIDSTAAGDSFNAGYLSAFICGMDEPEALMIAHNLAAEVVGHSGAIIPRQAMPSYK